MDKADEIWYRMGFRDGAYHVKEAVRTELSFVAGTSLKEAEDNSVKKTDDLYREMNRTPVTDTKCSKREENSS